MPHGILDCIPTDSGTQFTATLFELVYTKFGAVHLTTTMYHPHRSGHTKGYNGTLLKRPLHLDTEHQDVWNDYVQPLTNAYNMQVHLSTGLTPFDLVIT